MNFEELKKMIDDEVSKVVETQPKMESKQTLREPQIPKKKRPLYRPALKSEEEIDNALFFNKKKSDEHDGKALKLKIK